MAPPFTPGVCANPGGVPADGGKRSINLTARLRELLSIQIPEKFTFGAKLGMKKTHADKLVEILVKMGESGQLGHLSMIWDRVDGRVPITIQGAEGGIPVLQFNFVEATPTKTPASTSPSQQVEASKQNGSVDANADVKGPGPTQAQVDAALEDIGEAGK